MSPGKSFFFSRIFPLPFIIIGALILYFGWLEVQQAKQSDAWPEVKGQVQESSVAFKPGKKGGGTYHPEVFYTFTVDAQTYNGNTVAFGDFGSSNESHAQGIVNRYPKGKTVSVHYLVEDPKICVLESGAHWQVWILPGFGLIFLFAGVSMFFFLSRGR
jgi:Protein of unknown function (DUF3592)